METMSDYDTPDSDTDVNNADSGQAATTVDDFFGGPAPAPAPADPAAQGTDVPAPAPAPAVGIAPKKTVAAALVLLRAIGIGQKDPIDPAEPGPASSNAKKSNKKKEKNLLIQRVSLRIIMALVPKFKAALFEGPSGCPVTMAELTAGLQEHGAGFGYTELGDGCLSVAHYDKNTLHSELREGAVAVSNHPAKFDKRTRRAYISNAGPVDRETLAVLTQPIPMDADGKEGLVAGTAKYLKNLGSFKFKSNTKMFGSFEGKTVSELLKPERSVTGLLESLRSSPSPSGETSPNAGVHGCSHCLATNPTWKCPLCERVVKPGDKGGTKSDCIFTLTRLYSGKAPVAETPADTSSSSMASSMASSISRAGGGGSRKRARGAGFDPANGRGASNRHQFSSRQLAFNDDDNNCECSSSQEELLSIYEAIKVNTGTDAAHLFMAGGLDIVQANDKHRTPLAIDPAKVREVDSAVLARMQYAACAGAVTEQTLQGKKSYIFYAVDFARAHATQCAGGAMPAPPQAAYPALSTIVHKCADAANVERLIENLTDQGLTSTQLLQNYCNMCGENAMRDLCAVGIGMTGAEAAALLALLRGRAG